MRTRNRILPKGFGFQYREPITWPDRWHFVGGDLSPRTWPTAEERDAARACFARRRTVANALADLARLDNGERK